jgi:1,4-alpha-glucan branching enzyme
MKYPQTMTQRESKAGTRRPRAAHSEAAAAAPAARAERLQLDVHIEALIRGQHSDPFAVLGPHPISLVGQPYWAVRFFFPWAEAAEILTATGQVFPAEKLHPEGFFESVLPLTDEAVAPGSYRIRYRTSEGAWIEIHDPYAFPYLLSDFDLHLLGEGKHYDSFERLGAHARTVEGVAGVHFAVWAPNARRVSVVSDMSRWDGRVHPMRPRGSSGIWELFVPALGEGAVYKYEILSAQGELLPLKADPYGFGAELRPKTGSVVTRLDGYEWGDSGWMRERATRNWFEAPISIYEVHPGSWQRKHEEGSRWLTWLELAERLIPYAKQMGFTHIELLPVMEHPYDGSWGYQTLGYYAATSRYGQPREFMEFVDRCHQAGLGVILDWTPAHFPRDAHGLAQFDGTHLYEHADPRLGAHPDWGTLVYNYGRHEVRNFLISNAVFWLERFHIDGLRVDAVASMLYLDYSRKEGEWVPNEYGGRENLAAIAFLKEMNEVVHARQPGVLTIAEESTSWPGVSRPTYLGGLGFSFKWNMGWMNDTLNYMQRDPVYRKYEHNRMTFSMLYAFSENFILPFSHDEVVHGKASLLHKMPGDFWQQFANLRLLYAYQFAHPGKKLLFMGSELAQRSEWNHEASLEWHLLEYEPHRGVQRLLQDLNRLYASETALHEVDFDWHGFEWIDCHDADSSVLSFLRRGKNPDELMVVVANFTPVVRERYRIGVPNAGEYREVLNTDAAVYGGSNAGNWGAVRTIPEPRLGRPHSLVLTLPPLAAVFFKWVKESPSPLKTAAP